MLDSVIGHIAKLEFPEEEEGLKLAIIGRPNAGKSSLTNRLVGSERTIVSDVAGTTRDAIDTAFEYNEEKYVIIDTAGIRRKSKIEEDLEYYSVLRAMKAIGRADVCVMMLDAVEGLTDQDKRIAGIAHEEKKPLIICVNKWDLLEKDNKTMKKFEEGLRVDLPFLSYAPILFISAFTGQRVLNILKMANHIYEEYTKRISTGLLNSVLKDAIAVNEPPTRKGRAIKINYATQISAAPPIFAIFCNHPDLLHFSYIRYLENKFREAFGFEGCPIEFVVNKKND
jgi:GTP-binding protein